ncbi:MAG: N-acetylneuraminate synthase family protein, partial [Lachnospiraceae bacterium]|nr:N-acetylneuraminate synthase family protein [Lachnospiraceae bacterium]
MSKTLIIAEIGVNHNGNVNTAKKMIEVAKDCGADIVKFQTFNTDALTSKFAKMAEYQKKNMGEEKSQKDMLKSLA